MPWPLLLKILPRVHKYPPPWPGDEFTVFVHCPLSSENELEKVHCPNFCPLSTACPLSNFLSTVHCPLSNFLSTGHCPIYCPLSTVQRFWVGAGGGGGYLCTLILPVTQWKYSAKQKKMKKTLKKHGKIEGAGGGGSEKDPPATCSFQTHNPRWIIVPSWMKKFVTFYKGWGGGQSKKIFVVLKKWPNSAVKNLICQKSKRENFFEEKIFFEKSSFGI